MKVLFETNCDSVSLDLATYYYDTCIVSRVSAEKMMAEIHLPSYYHFSQPLIMDARLFGKLGDDWTYSDKFVIRFEPNQTAMPTSLFMQAIVDQAAIQAQHSTAEKKAHNSALGAVATSFTSQPNAKRHTPTPVTLTAKTSNTLA